MIPIIFAIALIPAGLACILYAWLKSNLEMFYMALWLVVGIMMIAGGVLYLIARAVLAFLVT